jgi:hypothetical protein
VKSPAPTPEVILTNYFAEPTVLLVPITSRENAKRILIPEGTLFCLAFYWSSKSSQIMDKHLYLHY